MLRISSNRHLDLKSGYLDLLDSKTFVANRHKSLFYTIFLHIINIIFLKQQEENNETLSEQC